MVITLGTGNLGLACLDGVRSQDDDGMIFRPAMLQVVFALKPSTIVVILLDVVPEGAEAKDMRTIRGVVHGKNIQLPEETGLQEGQEVTVTLVPVSPQTPSRQGFRASAGAWSDDAEELDKYLEWNRKQRKRGIDE